MKTAIVIEDVGPTREWLGQMVAAAFPGCAIHACGSVADAHAAMAQTTYDLALIDLGLPDGSGMEILRALTAGGGASPAPKNDIATCAPRLPEVHPSGRIGGLTGSV